MTHDTDFETPRLRPAVTRWRPTWRDLGLAAIVGAGIGVILWMGDPEEPFVPFIAASIWIGLWIYAASGVALAAGGRWLRGPSGPAMWAAVAVLFFLGGAGGFLAARVTLPAPIWLAALASGQRWEVQLGPGWGSLVFAGALGVVIGVAFFRFELLRGRLERSQERLRETELAERELHTAREIQARILPPPLVEGEGFRVVARNLPARIVAGDFYEVFRFGDGALGLAVADVAGKGIGASLVMASVKARLPLLAAERDVAATLVALNDALEAETMERQFVALCCVRFQPWDGAFELGNAGLPDPHLWSARGLDGSLVAPGPRLPLGLRQGLAYRTVAGRLEPGDRLLLFTDGLPEALTPAGEPLGYERLEELLAEQAGDSEERLDGLLAALKSETDHRLDDDWTAVVLERPGGAGGA